MSAPDILLLSPEDAYAWTPIINWAYGDTFPTDDILTTTGTRSDTASAMRWTAAASAGADAELRTAGKDLSVYPVVVGVIRGLKFSGSNDDASMIPNIALEASDGTNYVGGLETGQADGFKVTAQGSSQVITRFNLTGNGQYDQAIGMAFVVSQETNIARVQVLGYENNDGVLFYDEGGSYTFGAGDRLQIIANGNTASSSWLEITGLELWGAAVTPPSNRLMDRFGKYPGIGLNIID